MNFGINPGFNLLTRTDFKPLKADLEKGLGIANGNFEI